ncbi:MAG: hypothetical protein DWI68_04315 [Chloroflexi bacterium]|nr:MAG: hypothetical protein DWI68_04315 [Chloroflexota bacterium]
MRCMNSNGAASPAGPAQYNCTRCKRPMADFRFRPFCSQRCKNLGSAAGTAATAEPPGRAPRENQPKRAMQRIAEQNPEALAEIIRRWIQEK